MKQLKDRVAELKEQGLVPGLATVLVGEDPASQSYVGMKNKAAGEAGIYSRQITLPAETSEDELLGPSVQMTFVWRKSRLPGGGCVDKSGSRDDNAGDTRRRRGRCQRESTRGGRQAP